MKLIVLSALSLGSFFLGAQLCSAQIFADAITGSDFNAPAEKNLYISTALGAVVGNEAPNGTAIWFVIDENNNGVPTIGATAAQIQDMVSATPSGDNVAVKQDVVPGSLTLGNHVGEYKLGGITHPAMADNQHYVAYLFNDANHNSIIGDAGDTFGVYDFGTLSRASGGLGNLQFFIQTDMFADTFTVVPEPSQYVVASGVACLLFASIRAVRRKKASSVV